MKKDDHVYFRVTDVDEAAKQELMYVLINLCWDGTPLDIWSDATSHLCMHG